MSGAGAGVGSGTSGSGAAKAALTTSERYLAAFAASLSACGPQARAYAACAAARLPEVERGACEAEFGALKRCFYAEFAVRRRAAPR